ncbi:MAG: DUF3820 family protein [Chlamydiales bacterium]
MPIPPHERFICIDCEATGLDTQTDQIVEVAVALFDMKKVHATFESLINPQCEIPETSIMIHHITQDMVAEKPTIDQVLENILSLIGKHIIVGHNVAYDIALIANAAAKLGVSTTINENRFIDTVRLARHYGDSPKNSLEMLRAHFNIPPEGAHRAMNDVIVNMEVFRRLSTFYKSTQHLFETLSKPVLLKTMPLGPHKGRPMREVPFNYLVWMLNKDFDQDLMYSVKTEINRRKKGDLFQQAGNPFLDL